jgi:cell division transport system permease protein
MSRQPSGQNKTKIGNYPYASVIFSISLALFLLGLFGLLLINTNKLVRYIENNLEIQIYLQSNVTESQRQRLIQQLEAEDFVNKEATDFLRFISKEDAAADLMQQTGEDFVNFLGENPLRDAISFKLSPAFQDSAKLKEVERELAALPEVFEVSYIANIAQLLAKNRTKIAILLLAAALILTIIISTLINNTIKLALFSQRFLIRSMQLVGATKGFIMKPFLLKAGTYGLISGLIAGGLLAVLLFLLSREIDTLEVMKDLQMLAILWAGMLALGIIIAQLSTYRSLKKYLKVSLDELY